MTPGWHIGSGHGGRYYFKEGGGGGYHCEMRVYPSQGIASVIMVNRTVFNSRKFLNALDKELFPQGPLRLQRPRPGPTIRCQLNLRKSPSHE